jgi:putative transposase
VALTVYDALKGLGVNLAERRWSHDQSPYGGEATGPNPTDRGKCGMKRSMLTEGQGIPLAVVVAGANRLDVVVVERPEPNAEAPQPVCLDRDDDDACRHVAEQHEYIPHMWSRGEAQREKRENAGYRPRRWVVEVCHSWLNRFRKLLVRFKKKLETQLELRQFACAYIVLKRAGVFR